MGGVTRFPYGLGCGKRHYDGGVEYDGALPVVVDLGSPIAPDIDSIIDGATGTELPNAETVTYTTASIGTSPCDGANTTWILATPRNVVVTATHSSSIVAMTVTVHGKDLYGEAMSELFTVTATGTSKTFSGKKAFKTITSIVMVAAGDAEANTIEVGHADVLGLPYLMAYNTVLKEIKATAVATAGTVVVADVTNPATTVTGDVRGTYDPNDACDGSQYRIVYIPTSLVSRGITQA